MLPPGPAQGVTCLVQRRFRYSCQLDQCCVGGRTDLRRAGQYIGRVVGSRHVLGGARWSCNVYFFLDRCGLCGVRSVMPGEYFRAGAGAVILNTHGLVLALERKKIPEAWQLPQGGLERGEDPLAAVLREIGEETGISREELALLGDEPALLAYELPLNMRSEKTGRGQANYWFCFRF